ncbi:hypothetical protein RUND412_004102 [Rhizina undulata]
MASQLLHNIIQNIADGHFNHASPTPDHTTPHSSAAISSVFASSAKVTEAQGDSWVNLFRRKLSSPKFPETLKTPDLPERLFGNLSQRDALNVLTLDKHCYQAVIGAFTGKVVVGNRVLGMAGVCSRIGNICVDGEGEMITHSSALSARSSCAGVNYFDITHRASWRSVYADRMVQRMYKCKCPNPGEVARQRNGAKNNCIYEDEIELNNRIRAEE